MIIGDDLPSGALSARIAAACAEAGEQRGGSWPYAVASMPARRARSVNAQEVNCPDSTGRRNTGLFS